MSDITQDLIEILGQEDPDEYQVGQKLTEFMNTKPIDHYILANVLNLLEIKTPALYKLVFEDICEYIAELLVVQETTKHKPNGFYVN